MRRRLQWIIVLIECSRVYAKEPELPLCPTNIQYFPQNLPMHCRMPTPADLQNIQNLPMPLQGQTLPPFPPPIFQGQPGKPEAIPLPMPPGMPGLPGPMPGPMPMPMPMPMPLPGAPNPSHKLPVIVMPFYSPDNSFKKPQPMPEPRHKFRIHKRRKPRYYSDNDDSADTDTSSNELTDSEDEGLWKGRRSSRRSNKHHREKRRRRQRHELLTPILQYVTKEGYVIFEKKISKGEAKDWLKPKTDIVESTTRTKQEIDEFDEVEDGEVRFEKEEKVEIRTEKNPLKPHKKKLKYKMPKKTSNSA